MLSFKSTESDAVIWNHVWDRDEIPTAYSFLPSRYERALEKVSYFIRAGVTFSTHDRVLEAGCGDGLVSLSLLSLFDVECHGVDFSENARKCALKAMGESNRYFDFSLADIRNTNYPDDYFDKIICLGVIEHFDPLDALIELRRILKPGGTLILMTPNRLSSGKWQRILCQKLGKWEFGYQTEYTPDELAVLVEQAGLSSQKTEVCLRYRSANHCLQLQLIAIFDQLVNAVMPKWGFYSYVFATK